MWICGTLLAVLIIVLFSYFRLVGLHSALAIQAHDEARMFSKEGGLGRPLRASPSCLQPYLCGTLCAYHTAILSFFVRSEINFFRTRIWLYCNLDPESDYMHIWVQIFGCLPQKKNPKLAPDANQQKIRTRPNPDQQNKTALLHLTVNVFGPYYFSLPGVKYFLATLPRHNWGCLSHPV